MTTGFSLVTMGIVVTPTTSVGGTVDIAVELHYILSGNLKTIEGTFCNYEFSPEHDFPSPL